MMSLMLAVWAQSYRQINDIPYTTKTDTYAAERLKLDIYYPKKQNGCPVVVWFHGGGLEGGEKQIPEQLKNKGWVVVGVNYRFLPRVTVDKIIDDAAEAVAWVFNNIERYGGDRRKMVVTGHSAGGYLAMMLCLDKKWLAAYGADADSVMLYAPFSGQAVTHFKCASSKASLHCGLLSTSMPHSTGFVATALHCFSSAATGSWSCSGAMTRTSIWHG